MYEGEGRGESSKPRVQDPDNLGFFKAFRRHGGMRYYVLWLLNSRPMKGSEIMDEMQRQSMGWWRPSPGSIYPLLNALEKDGFVSRNEDMRYALSKKGKKEMGFSSLYDEGLPIERALSELESYVSYLEEERADASLHLSRLEEIHRRMGKLIAGLRGG